MLGELGTQNSASRIRKEKKNSELRARYRFVWSSCRTRRFRFTIAPLRLPTISLSGFGGVLSARRTALFMRSAISSSERGGSDLLFISAPVSVDNVDYEILRLTY